MFTNCFRNQAVLGYWRSLIMNFYCQLFNIETEFNIDMIDNRVQYWYDCLEYRFKSIESTPYVLH